MKVLDSGYHVSATPYTTSCLSSLNFAHLFVHGLEMCMWFGFNPAVNFCHFSTLLTLSFFAGVTSTSPKFDLYFWLGITGLQSERLRLIRVIELKPDWIFSCC